MPLGVFDCCSFLLKHYKLKVVIFCPSPGVHMYRARVTCLQQQQSLQKSLLIPKCIVQRCFWLLTIPHISVFLCSSGILVTPSCSWCVFVEKIFVQVLPFWLVWGTDISEKHLETFLKHIISLSCYTI